MGSGDVVTDRSFAMVRVSPIVLLLSLAAGVHGGDMAKCKSSIQGLRKAHHHPKPIGWLGFVSLLDTTTIKVIAGECDVSGSEVTETDVTLEMIFGFQTIAGSKLLGEKL